MRVARVLLCLTALVSFSLQTQAQGTTIPSAQKDAQAITILSQAVVALGGSTAISAIKDYSGTGTMIFHQSQTEQVSGTVTISGLGRGEFRMDSNLSTGTRSFSIDQGRTHQKREDGTVTHLPPQGPVPSSDAFPYVSPIFPSGIGFPNQELLAALNNPQLNVVYKGMVQLNGSSAHDVQVQRVQPMTPNPNDPMLQYETIDLFIDTTSFQIIMTQELVPKHVIHQIHYSNYQPVGAVLVPWSMSELMGGQRTWDIRLAQISFNTGLQDSNFTF